MTIRISFPVGLCLLLLLGNHLGNWELGWGWILAPVWVPIALIWVIWALGAPRDAASKMGPHRDDLSARRMEERGK